MMDTNPVVEVFGRRLRLAVIGGGPGSFIGAVHRTAARLDDRFELVAGALSSDPTRSRAAGMAIGLASERSYPDALTLLDGEAAREDGAEVVAIMTPNDTHHGYSSSALDRGFDVISDKPMTNTLAEALDLVARVKRSRLVFCLTHNYTGYPRDDAERLWLLLAVVTATLPKADDVLALQRRSRLDGPVAAVKDVERLARTRYALRLADAVDIVSGVVVDADHTARSSLVTGIQRVVRQTISHWARDRRFTLLGWDDSYSRLRRLNSDERENALWGTSSQPVRERRAGGVVVPWDCDYVLIELATETERTARIQALGRLSATRLHVVGHDCVPITTAETVGPGMGGVFAKTLSAMAVATNVATTSVASTAEYSGWRSTLSAIGLSGPRIGEVMLPTDVDEAALAVARAGASQPEDADPLLLSVGSHEPRKNHLAILQAAETLWREGLRFRIVFVGGNSWNSTEFSRLSGAMKEAGRPIETLKGLSDDALWRLYASASLTLFPSVNEGFGLPVAESLAMGVPVITSDFGSMREIAQAGGGALLVDPRDDEQIADSIRSFLTTPSLRERLRTEAASRARRPWQAYADELWSFFDLGELSRSASPVDVS